MAQAKALQPQFRSFSAFLQTHHRLSYTPGECSEKEKPGHPGRPETPAPGKRSAPFSRDAAAEIPSRSGLPASPIPCRKQLAFGPHWLRPTRIACREGPAFVSHRLRPARVPCRDGPVFVSHRLRPARVPCRKRPVFVSHRLRPARVPCRKRSAFGTHRLRPARVAHRFNAASRCGGRRPVRSRVPQTRRPFLFYPFPSGDTVNRITSSRQEVGRQDVCTPGVFTPGVCTRRPGAGTRAREGARGEAASPLLHGLRMPCRPRRDDAYEPATFARPTFARAVPARVQGFRKGPGAKLPAPFFTASGKLAVRVGTTRTNRLGAKARGRH